MKKLILLTLLYIILQSTTDLSSPFLITKAVAEKDVIVKSESSLPSITKLIEDECERIQTEIRIKELNEKKELLKKQQEEELKIKKSKEEELKRKKSSSVKSSTRSYDRNSNLYTITCYDLSVQSCGKPVGHKNYGITASGFNLTGHTWETARAVAVDPRRIPLGSKIKITFTNEKYSKYNGIYTAVDTGGAIKGNKLDFFLGDFNQNEAHPSTKEFGKTQAIIEIIK